MTARSLRAAALAAATVGSLCLLLASPARPARAGEPDPAGRKVRAVEFEGLRRLSPYYLRSKVRTRVGDPLDPEVLAADVARLYALGELVSEAGIDVVTRNDEGGVVVTFRVRERARVDRVVIRGRDALALGEIAEGLLSKKGALLDELHASADDEKIRRTYLEQGYLHVKVAHATRPARSGAAGEVDLVFDIDEGPRVRIDEIVFEGSLAFDAGALEDVIETEEALFFGLVKPGALDERRLEDDVERLLGFYRRHGYLDARVHRDAVAWLDAERTRVRVTFHVVEGARYVVSEVTLRGVTLFDAEALRRELVTAAGEPFDGTALERDLATIRRRYGERSYVLCRPALDLSYDHARARVAVAIDVEEGGPVVVDRVIIEGNDKTRDEVIRRELGILPGEPFDVDAAEKSLERLGRRRWFDDVRIRFEDAATRGRKDVVVRVEEARTGTWRAGAGASSDGGFFGDFSFTQRNFDITRWPRSLDDFLDGRAFAGRGQSFSVHAQPGLERSTYRVSFSEPWLLGWPLALNVDGFVFDRDYRDYTESRTGGRVGFGYRVHPDATVRLDWRLERVRIHAIEPDAIADVHQVAGTSDISSLVLSFEVDRNVFDRHLLAIDGWGARIALERAGDFMGGDLDFTRASAEASWQTTVFEFPRGYRHVVGARGAVGWIEGYGRTRDVPIFERFFAGGAGSIRGFEPRGIGPRAAGEARGGGFMARASVECGFPILPGDILRGVLFADAATLVSEIDDFLLTDRREQDGVRLSVGFGLRLSLPYFPAPVRFDFGFPIVKMRDDEERVFSFGVSVGF